MRSATERMRASLIVSVDPPTGETGRAHFDLVLAQHGLSQPTS